MTSSPPTAPTLEQLLERDLAAWKLAQAAIEKARSTSRPAAT